MSASALQTTNGPPHAQIFGNRIGVGRDDRAMGNGISANYPSILVGLGGHCRVAIGGEGPGEGNLIAHGGNAGVAIGSCWHAPILGNSFTGNRGIAIDLARSNGFDGPTPNDPGDADAPGNDPTAAFGGNRFLNYPVVSLPPDFIAEGGGSSVALSYVVDAAGNTSEFGPMVGDELFSDGLETEPATFGPGRCD